MDECTVGYGDTSATASRTPDGLRPPLEPTPEPQPAWAGTPGETGSWAELCSMRLPQPLLIAP